jgi:hypothetical protein
VSFLESGLTVETKVKPDSRKDTDFDDLSQAGDAGGVSTVAQREVDSPK